MSALLLNNILFLFCPYFSVTFITHSDSPLTSLGVSICPIKTCPDFLLSAYFFGSNFLFLCPKSLFHLTSISAHFWAALAVWKAVQSREAVHMFFYNFKVVLLHMLCPYQFQGGSLPVFCDVHDAKWRKKKQKKHESSTNYYKMGEKKCSPGLNDTSSS